MEDNKSNEVNVKSSKSSYNRTYYEKNIEKITQRITCGCGLTYTKSNKSIHCSGRLHKLWQKMTDEKDA